MKTTVTLRDHPESMALAALEFAADRADLATRLVTKIGEPPGHFCGDTMRRQRAVIRMREAAEFLEQAALLVEAGI